MNVGSPSVTSTLPSPDAFARPRSVHVLLFLTRSADHRNGMMPSASSLATSTVRECYRRDVEQNRPHGGPLREMGRRAFAFEPAPHRRDVTAQRVWRVAHVDAERLVDRRMADAESEDETSVGRVRDERCALSAGVGMTHVDVGDPGANLNAPGCRAHELSGRHDIVVDLGREDRIEACLLGFAGDRLDFASAPADTGNDGESESFGHGSLLSRLLECLVAALPAPHLITVRVRCPRHVLDEGDRLRNLDARDLAATERADAIVRGRGAGRAHITYAHSVWALRRGEQENARAVRPLERVVYHCWPSRLNRFVRS